MNRIPDRSDSRRASKNLMNSLDADEFKGFKEVHDDADDDDGRIDNSVPSNNSLSVEDETSDGTGKFCVLSHMFVIIFFILK